MIDQSIHQINQSINQSVSQSMMHVEHGARTKFIMYLNVRLPISCRADVKPDSKT